MPLIDQDTYQRRIAGILPELAEIPFLEVSAVHHVIGVSTGLGGAAMLELLRPLAEMLFEAAFTLIIAGERATPVRNHFVPRLRLISVPDATETSIQESIVRVLRSGKPTLMILDAAVLCCSHFADSMKIPFYVLWNGPALGLLCALKKSSCKEFIGEGGLDLLRDVEYDGTDTSWLQHIDAETLMKAEVIFINTIEGLEKNVLEVLKEELAPFRGNVRVVGPLISQFEWEVEERKLIPHSIMLSLEECEGVQIIRDGGNWVAVLQLCGRAHGRWPFVFRAQTEIAHRIHERFVYQHFPKWFTSLGFKEKIAAARGPEMAKEFAAISLQCRNKGWLLDVCHALIEGSVSYC